jgi:hypothetical protein
MVNTLGQYSPSGGKRRLTKREMDELRNNMKKVPEIQEKSEEYHEMQAKDADNELDSKLIQEVITPQTGPQDIPKPEIQKSTLWQKIWKWLVDKR